MTQHDILDVVMVGMPWHFQIAICNLILCIMHVGFTLNPFFDGVKQDPQTVKITSNPVAQTKGRLQNRPERLSIYSAGAYSHTIRGDPGRPGTWMT
jgi:hypothetical protein